MVKVIGKFNPKLPSTGFSESPKGDSYLTTAARNVISPALTAAESIAGIPGDILQSAGNISAGIAGLTGNQLEPTTPTEIPFSSQGLRKNVREPLSKYFGTERLTLPQGELEERFNDFVGDFASLFVGNKDPRKALKIAGLGNVAGFAAHGLGASPGEEGLAKVGGMILSSLHGGRAKLAEDASQRYKQVQENIKEKNIKIPGTVKKLDELNRKVTSGGSTAAKKAAKEQIDTLMPQFFGDNEINAENLWDFKKDINETISRLRKNDPERKYLEQLVGIADDGLKAVGSEYKNLKSADEIFGSLAASDKIGSFLNKNLDAANIKTPYLRTAIKNIGGISTAGGISKLGSLATGLPTAGITAGIGGAGILANEGFKFMNLLQRSPIARETYFNMLMDGLKGNSLAASRNIAKLDKIASKFEENQPPQQRVRVIGKLPALQ